MSRHLSLIQQTGMNGQTQIIPLVAEDNEMEHINEVLKLKLEQLETSLLYEKSLRQSAEEKVKKLEEEIQMLKQQLITRKRRTKKEMEQQAELEYSEFTSTGKRKAQAAEPIRSYDDFASIQQYFLDRNNIRDWMLWTVGVSLGLRISDLFSIRIRHFLNTDFTFKPRMKVLEKKTSKLNDCLITESVVDAITKYFDSIKWVFDFDDYLFKSQKTKEKMCEQHGWKIISNAGKSLKLPVHIGSHTMRKSFANIAACVDNSSIDMNTITKIQGLLNHGDQRVTMKYLGTFRDMYDRARRSVSDFILGKTQINELTAGNNYSLEDVVKKLDALETKFFDTPQEE